MTPSFRNKLNVKCAYRCADNYYDDVPLFVADTAAAAADRVTWQNTLDRRVMRAAVAAVAHPVKMPDSTPR